jgi:hypothetical protein
VEDEEKKRALAGEAVADTDGNKPNGGISR